MDHFRNFLFSSRYIIPIGSFFTPQTVKLLPLSNLIQPVRKIGIKSSHQLCWFTWCLLSGHEAQVLLLQCSEKLLLNFLSDPLKQDKSQRFKNNALVTILNYISYRASLEQKIDNTFKMRNRIQDSRWNIRIWVTLRDPMNINYFYLMCSLRFLSELIDGILKT